MESHFEKIQYNRAKSRMREIKSLYTMIGGCLILIPYLIFINLKTNPEFQWFWFPVAGFVISISGYAFYLFVGRDWEERKIRELMEEEKRRNSKSL